MLDNIMELINNNLFPIAMCLLLYYDKRESDKRTKEELDLMSDSLNSNTLAIQRLSDILDRKE